MFVKHADWKRNVVEARMHGIQIHWFHVTPTTSAIARWTMVMRAVTYQTAPIVIRKAVIALQNAIVSIVSLNRSQQQQPWSLRKRTEHAFEIAWRSTMSCLIRPMIERIYWKINCREVEIYGLHQQRVKHFLSQSIIHFRPLLDNQNFNEFSNRFSYGAK